MCDISGNKLVLPSLETAGKQTEFINYEYNGNINRRVFFY
jgi:hypothetical protein